MSPSVARLPPQQVDVPGAEREASAPGGLLRYSVSARPHRASAPCCSSSSSTSSSSGCCPATRSACTPAARSSTRRRSPSCGERSTHRCRSSSGPTCATRSPRTSSPSCGGESVWTVIGDSPVADRAAARRLDDRLGHDRDLARHPQRLGARRQLRQDHHGVDADALLHAGVLARHAPAHHHVDRRRPVPGAVPQRRGDLRRASTRARPRAGSTSPGTSSCPPSR